MWEGRQTDVQKGECSNIYTYSTYIQTDRQDKQKVYNIAFGNLQEITRNNKKFCMQTYRKLCEIKSLTYKISTFSKFKKVTFVKIPGVHKPTLIYLSFLHSVKGLNSKKKPSHAICPLITNLLNGKILKCSPSPTP